MGSFSFNGEYRFIYTDHSDQRTVVFVDAYDDDDAVSFAKTVQRGLMMEVWKGRDRISTFEAPGDLQDTRPHGSSGARHETSAQANADR